MADIRKYSSQVVDNISIGQAGSILIDQGTADADADPLIGVFVAIQFIEDTVIAKLSAETAELYPASNGKSTSIDANAGSYATAVTFPQGMTIFGRWTSLNLTSGACIAYIG